MTAGDQFDQHGELAPFMDRHLMYQILEDVLEKKVYPEKDVVKVMVDLLKGTDLLDEAEKRLAELGKDGGSLAADKKTLAAEIETMKKEVQPLLSILEKDEEKRAMLKNGDLQSMCEACGLEEDIFEKLYAYAQKQYSSGDYKLASSLLSNYQTILSTAEALDPSKQILVTWGLFACDIFLKKWDSAADCAVKLDELFETHLSKVDQIVQRTWLLHWSLFVIFRAPKVPSKILDLFLAEKSLLVILAACPALLRYVAAILVIHRRTELQEILTIIQNESHLLTDPLIKFLSALYFNLDFDEAQTRLKDTQRVFEVDAFLGKWEDFQESARLHIFEVYCRVHQKIDMSMIAEKLSMAPEDAELWIVKLIQNAKLDAKIDSEKNRVMMGKQTQNVYQNVIERTKTLSFRSMLLMSNLENKAEIQA